MSTLIQAFRDAELRLFEAFGLRRTEHSLELSRPAMRARVLETGEGPAVLHVHGGGGFGALHVPLAAALPGHRHLLVDRPGFGLSEFVSVDDDLRAHAVSFLRAVLDGLKLETFDVVGHSIGGLWALWLAADCPERVRSVSLVGGPALVGRADAPWILRLLSSRLGAFLMRLEPPSPRQVRTYFRRFAHEPDTLHPAILEVMLAGERLPDFTTAFRAILAATMSLRGVKPGLLFSVEDLRRLRVPLSFAWGANDPMVPVELGRYLAAELPDARFTVVGRGHAPWLDDASGVAAAISPVLAVAQGAAAASRPRAG